MPDNDSPLTVTVLPMPALRSAKLAPVDTGRQIGEVFALNEAIRATFEALGYATAAFVRVSEIWSEVPADRYAAQIEQVAAEVAIYAGWQALFAACVPRIPVLVVSAGIPRVWRQILDRHGFPEVPVIPITVNERLGSR